MLDNEGDLTNVNLMDVSSLSAIGIGAGAENQFLNLKKIDYSASMVQSSYKINDQSMIYNDQPDKHIATF